MRRDDNERVRGVGPNTTAQTGRTLVGLSERRVSDPSDGSVFVRQGSRHGSTKERSTARSPVDPVR